MSHASDQRSRSRPRIFRRMAQQTVKDRVQIGAVDARAAALEALRKPRAAEIQRLCIGRERASLEAVLHRQRRECAVEKRQVHIKLAAGGKQDFAPDIGHRSDCMAEPPYRSNVFARPRGDGRRRRAARRAQRSVRPRARRCRRRLCRHPTARKATAAHGAKRCRPVLRAHRRAGRRAHAERRDSPRVRCPTEQRRGEPPHRDPGGDSEIMPFGKLGKRPVVLPEVQRRAVKALAVAVPGAVDTALKDVRRAEVLERSSV